MFSLTNPMHSDVFPSVRRMEGEVVAMTASLLGGARRGGGVRCGWVLGGCRWVGSARERESSLCGFGTELPFEFTCPPPRPPLTLLPAPRPALLPPQAARLATRACVAP